jgi:hypothetical protein
MKEFNDYQQLIHANTAPEQIQTQEKQDTIYKELFGFKELNPVVDFEIQVPDSYHVIQRCSIPRDGSRIRDSSATRDNCNPRDNSATRDNSDPRDNSVHQDNNASRDNSTTQDNNASRDNSVPREESKSNTQIPTNSDIRDWLNDLL